MLLFGEEQAMNLIKLTRLFRQDTSASTHIPITHLAASDVFETRDGMLGAVLKVTGVAYLTAEECDLNACQRAVHQAVQQLGAQFIVMETLHRRRESTTLTGTFDSVFCQQLNDKYHQGFAGGVYVNDLYLTLLYKGSLEHTKTKGLVNRLMRTTQGLMDKTVLNAREVQRVKGLHALHQKVNQWTCALSRFGVKRLGDAPDGTSDLLSFLSLVPNGGKKCSLKRSPYFPVRAKTLRNTVLANEHHPKGHVGQYIANHRLFFGEAIQFQGNATDDSRFAAMLSLKTYNDETSSCVLDAVLALDAELIRTQTFAPIESAHAIKTIQQAHSKKISANDYAISQLKELGDLSDLVASEKVTLGFHHNTLMVLADTKEALENTINRATQAYAAEGLIVVRETLASTLSFFAQIPGNGHLIVRSSLITSENFADFCALHNTQSGYRDRCVLGGPVTLVQTLQKTPVFWNYHTPGPKNEPTKGHTLFIGGNNAGKTAIACFLDAQMSRFEGHRTFFLDRNQSAKIYILACGGTYLTLSPSNTSECQMNPLQLPDTRENRDFCKRWMEALLLDENEVSVGSVINETINGIIDYGFDSLAPSDRRLSTVSQLLPIDFPRWSQLRRWLCASDGRHSGQYAWAFDNDTDALNLNADKTGIDLTYLMDNVPTHLSTPFYMYLMHRIQLCLDGRVTSIIIDEMWQVLKSPYWESALVHYLPTIRKLFGHIIGLTQSPETIVNSPIRDVMLNNVANLVLFANPKASDAVYMDALQLTPQEFKLIQSNSPESRLVLYKQENESIWCHLDLSAVADELYVLSGNVNTVRFMDSLRAELGTSPERWLPTFIRRCVNHE
jgi:type IV secretion system protein VirB4